MNRETRLDFWALLGSGSLSYSTARQHGSSKMFVWGMGQRPMQMSCEACDIGGQNKARHAGKDKEDEDGGGCDDDGEAM